MRYQNSGNVHDIPGETEIIETTHTGLQNMEI